MHTVLMIAQMGAVHSAKPVHHVLAGPLDDFNSEGYNFTRQLLSWAPWLLIVALILALKMRKAGGLIGMTLFVSIMFLGGVTAVRLFLAIFNNIFPHNQISV